MQTWHVETELYLLLGQCDMSLAAQLGLWLAHVEARQLQPRMESTARRAAPRCAACQSH